TAESTTGQAARAQARRDRVAAPRQGTPPARGTPARPPRAPRHASARRERLVAMPETTGTPEMTGTSEMTNRPETTSDKPRARTTRRQSCAADRSRAHRVAALATLFAFLFLITFSSVPAHGAPSNDEPTASLALSTDTVDLGDTFIYQITIDGV